MIDRIVLNIPHSSADFPAGAKSLWTGDIDPHINRWTDWGTAYIFGTAALTDPRIHPVIFPWSRFYCDAERLEDDPLEKVGQGLAYTRFKECNRLLSEPEKDEIYRQYILHKAAVMEQLTPLSLLIDCHSFPADLSTVEVCIGYNSGFRKISQHSILRIIKDFFEHNGYDTAFNKPYSKSYSPEMPFQYASVMIELNKGLYMNPDGSINIAKADRLRNLLGYLYDQLLAFNEAKILGINLKFLWENRRRILFDQRMAGATLHPQQNGYFSTLGELLSALEDNPELFFRKDKAIISFTGDPDTGQTENRTINLNTGDMGLLKEGLYKEKSAARDKAYRRYPRKEGALPLSIVIEELKKG